MVVIVFVTFVVYFSSLQKKKLSSVPTVSQSQSTSPIDQNPQVSQPPTLTPTPTLNPQYSTRLVFDMRGQNNKFGPDTFVAHRGQIVAFALTAVDHVYDLTFPSLGISKTVQTTETKYLEFMADKAGTYEFVCQEYCGGEAKGTLTIKAD